MDPIITQTDEPEPGLVEAVFANFHAHSLAQGVPSDFRPLALNVTRDGVMLGGLVARTGRGWLYIDYLALPMAEQGAGIGRRLMAMAEQEATARGCTGAYLNTFQFQAPAFYEKLGYREFARLTHDDPRQTRIWYSKRLLGADLS